MNTVPNRLRLSNGRLEMIDGSNLTDYLKASPIADGSDVIVLRRDRAEQLYQYANAYLALMDGRYPLVS